MSGPGKPTRREKLAWCFFDFANSSFTTVIVTVVFAQYFIAVVVPGKSYRGLHEDSWWALAGAVSNGLVILSAPLIGAMADQRARKKRYLLHSYLACIAATALLTLSGPEWVLPALGLFIAGNVAFGTGENLIAGFLPELAGHEEMGRLSAAGWTLGYFGGLASLFVALLFVNAGLVEWTCAATAAFFGLAGLPTFLWLRERATPAPKRAREPLFQAAFGRLRETFGERRRYRDLFTFLASILLFQGGIAIVVAFAAIFAKEEIGLDDQQVIILFVGLQFAAAAGAWVFGHLQDRVGSKPTLFLSLAVWILAVVCVWASHGPGLFFVASALAGIGMGSSQAASRAVVGVFCPSGREAEWFGLWGLATKGAALIALILYAALVNFADRRAAILGVTTALFAGGMAVLTRVNIARGMKMARETANSERAETADSLAPPRPDP